MTRPRRPAREILLLALASGFGTGYLPGAPGTWGSLLAVGLFLLAAIGGPVVAVALAFAAGVGGFPLATVAEKIAGRKDAQFIVIDEMAGMLLLLSAVHFFHPDVTVASLLYSFAVFRFFDIAKPFPVCRLQALPRGWGVMTDDLAAAALSAPVSIALLSIRGASPGIFGRVLLPFSR